MGRQCASNLRVLPFVSEITVVIHNASQDLVSGSIARANRPARIRRKESALDCACERAGDSSLKFRGLVSEELTQRIEVPNSVGISVG